MAGRLPTLAVAAALCAACEDGCGRPIDRLEVAPVAESEQVARLSWSVPDATNAELVVSRADGTEELLRRLLDAPELASGGTDVVGLEAETTLRGRAHGEEARPGWKTRRDDDDGGPVAHRAPSRLPGKRPACRHRPATVRPRPHLLDLSNPAAVVAFDGTGWIRWYRILQTGGVTFEAKQLASGNFTVFVYGLDGARDAFVELTPRGAEVRRIAAPAPYQTDESSAIRSRLCRPRMLMVATVRPRP